MADGKAATVESREGFCILCGQCVAVCPTGSLFFQGSAVGEMKHSADLIRMLASARRRHEWVDPEVPA